MKRFLLAAMPILILAGCIKKELQPAAPPVVVSTSDTVMYYWSFNTLDTSNHAPDFGITTKGTFDYFASYIDTTTGTSIDALPGVDSGECLRLRNPSDSIVFHMPTTGYDSIVFEFAEEATGSGSSSNSIYYTTDGIHYISTALAINNYNVGLVFQAYTFDFSSDPNTNGCANFAIAIVMNNSNTGTSGNDRFDNVKLRGVRQ
jgi:hypothetical protein